MKHLNFNQRWIGEKTLMPVGSYEAGKSPFGAYDMAGNVWEWVNDWYDATLLREEPGEKSQRPGDRHKESHSRSRMAERDPHGSHLYPRGQRSDDSE